MQVFPIGRVYDFMAARKVALIISSILMLGTALLAIVPGPKWGTDFRGGTEIEVAFTGQVTGEDIRHAIADSGLSSPDVIAVADEKNPYRFIIRIEDVATLSSSEQDSARAAFCFGETVDATACPEAIRPIDVKFSPGGERISLRYGSAPDLADLRKRAQSVSFLQLRPIEPNPVLVDPRENKVELLLQSQGAKMMTALRAGLTEAKVPETPLRIEWVGPKAGAQLRNSAFASIAIAIVLIMVYIAFRFDLRFAPGAVISLAHDAIVPVGVLILMGRELSLTTVAALLTIIGYSVNDTVVVYDRIRENLGKMRGATFDQIINVSLSEMLSRTILTSSTAIVGILAFLVWGTGSLKDFALTLVIGMISGIYSSIYIALPLTAWLDQKLFRSGRNSKAQRSPAPIRKKTAAVV
jgi:preprotein translocase subunit SecF